MAYQKGGSVIFKRAHHVSLRVLKTAIDGEIKSSIVIFQGLGNEEYLIKLEATEDEGNLIKDVFDVKETRVSCYPPQA